MIVDMNSRITIIKIIREFTEEVKPVSNVEHFAVMVLIVQEDG